MFDFFDIESFYLFVYLFIFPDFTWLEMLYLKMYLDFF